MEKTQESQRVLEKPWYISMIGHYSYVLYVLHVYDMYYMYVCCICYNMYMLCRILYLRCIWQYGKYFRKNC